MSLLIIGISGISFAQVSVDGEFRTRSILENGFKTPAKKGSDVGLSFDQRTRLIVNYKNEKYSTRITLQDARIWGSDDLLNRLGTQGSSSALGLYEAWVNVSLGEKSNLKIGRQEWNYDDMRILSWRNWWTSGQSYDGLVYQFSSLESGFNIDLGLSYNNNGSATGVLIDNSTWQGDKLKTMNFLSVKKKLGKQTSGALIFTLSGKTDVSNGEVKLTGTHGLILNHNMEKTGTGGFVFSLSAYYQHGQDLNKGSDGAYKNISSYLLAANAGFRTTDTKVELLLGAELISGHDYTNSDPDYNNTRHSFDLLYGGRIPYYGGYLNHFIAQDSYSVGTNGGGYFDPYIRLKYTINKKNKLEASVFSPMLSTKVRAHTGIHPETQKPSGSEIDSKGNPVYWKGNLGQYIDMNLTHIFSKEMILKAGVSMGFVSDTKNQMTFGYKNIATKELHEMSPNYSGWVMLLIQPNFFTSGK